MSGYVYLVGAGCGSADLITVRGARLISQCDCLVYDDLIDAELLNSTRPDCEMIYMGKRSGAHSAPQQEISAKLVEKALEGKTVVRLKGGDPFVFGRGGEEILALQEADIGFEEVPGISSCIAVPASVGIPVTHRGKARSFHVVTGHTADTADSLPEGLENLAKCEGTLVFLMGLKNLPGIAAGLVRFGKSAETPAAVISGADREHPKAVRGVLSDIARKVQDAGLLSPAVIVVGDVAALELADTKQLPLTGRHIGLTGTDAITGKLASGLQALGASVTTLLRSKVVRLPFDLKAATDGKPHWLAFTSSNGVREFFAQAREEGIDYRKFSALRFAVIGAATGKTLEGYGFHADLIPDEATSHGLGLALQEAVKDGEDVLLYRSARGSRELLQLLDERAIPWTDIPTYDLQPEIPMGASPKKMDYLAFSSASGVNLFADAFGGIPEGVKCVCIGTVTAAALERRGVTDYLMASEISAEGILTTILADN